MAGAGVDSSLAATKELVGGSARGLFFVLSHLVAASGFRIRGAAIVGLDAFNRAFIVVFYRRSFTAVFVADHRYRHFYCALCQ